MPFIVIFSFLLTANSYAEDMPDELTPNLNSQSLFEILKVPNLFVENDTDGYKQKYQLKWQIRLLAIQYNFASSLTDIDMVKTEPITHQE